MSRISGRQDSLDSLITIERQPDDVRLPQRYLLPPDGHVCEAHIENLYPANRSQKPLIAFACPSECFAELLGPHAFRRALATLRQQLRGADGDAFEGASQLLAERSDDEVLLRQVLHLLHKA